MGKKPTYAELEQRVKEFKKEAVDRKQTEEALRESEERYRTLFEGAAEGIIVADIETRKFKYVNPASCRMLGYSEEELKRMSVVDIHPKEALEHVISEFEAQAKGEKALAKNIPCLRKDGTTIYADINTTKALIDGRGCNVGFFTDITERKEAEEALRKAHDELETRVEERTAELSKANDQLKQEIEERNQVEEALRESKEKYSTLVKNALTGIYIDQDGKIVFANERFGEIYGYPREECIGIESWKLVHPDDRPLTNQMRARRLKGEHVPSEYEAMGLTKKGETIWIRRRNTNIEYGGKPAILGNVVDITEEKRAEEKLRKINKELKSFVDVVSHDLKTPIIAIQGFSSRLFKNNQEKLGEKGERYLELINASARRMEVLVSDLLALSSSGQVLSTFVNISSLEIVENVSSGLRDKLKENRIELVVTEDLPPIYCDGERIYQVFENLLVNAIKYMGDTENPKIEIGFKDNGGFHKFYVRDNGVGIDAKYHQKVFEMFHRLREVEKEEGTGLGLAIVERIVNTHGGRVWVESEKGKGATFYFTLPKKES